MRKIKIFYDNNYSKAEEQLNDFVVKNHFSIVDVKYHIFDDANGTVSLLLIYNDGKRL